MQLDFVGAVIYSCTQQTIHPRPCRCSTGLVIRDSCIRMSGCRDNPGTSYSSVALELHNVLIYEEGTSDPRGRRSFLFFFINWMNKWITIYYNIITVKTEVSLIAGIVSFPILPRSRYLVATILFHVLFGMLVIRRLLGILTFLRVLLLTQLLIKDIQLRICSEPIDHVRYFWSVNSVFVKLAQITRFLFCFNFISIFDFSAWSP